MSTRSFVLGSTAILLHYASAAAAEPRDGQTRMPDVSQPHRSLTAIQVDVHNALRAEASSRRLGPIAADVLRVIDLYREMASHPKRHDSPLLQRLGLQVRSRLKDVCDRIDRQIARKDKRVTNSKRLSALAPPETHLLAQQFGAAGAGQGAPPAAPLPGATGEIDYGPELVDIIQQTISPATWDINGGNGSVVYFAPLRVIVVSAPATVHGQVGDVLGQLRAAP